MKKLYLNSIANPLVFPKKDCCLISPDNSLATCKEVIDHAIAAGYRSIWYDREQKMLFLSDTPSDDISGIQNGSISLLPNKIVVIKLLRQMLETDITKTAYNLAIACLYKSQGEKLFQGMLSNKIVEMFWSKQQQ